jgi:hypothetical protein
MSFLVWNIIGIALALIGPAAAVFLGGTTHIFAIIASEVAAQIGMDLNGLAGDIASGDKAAIVNDFVQLGYDAVDSIVNSLSPEALIGLALVDGLWDFGTEGVGALVDLGAGAIGAGFFVGQLITESMYDWGNTAPSP